MAISLSSRSHPRTKPSNLSPLCYVCKSYPQYQVAVKLLGSFRLTAGNRHLHRYCIFTERVPETVLQSLHHSCASELHLSLIVPLAPSKTSFPTFLWALDYIFISFLYMRVGVLPAKTGWQVLLFKLSRYRVNSAHIFGVKFLLDIISIV